jgi:MFS family permease
MIAARLGGKHMTISNDAAWPRPAYAWYVVAVLSVANLFSFLDRTVLNLLVTPVKRALSLSDTEIGLVQGAAFGIFYTLMILPFGWLADRTARNRIVSLGIAVWSVITAACGLAGSFLQLFAARVGVGIGEATLSAAVGSLVSDHFPAERRTLPLSVYTMVGSMGAGVALLLGGVVAELITGVDHVDLPLLGTLQPWQVVFIAVGAPGVAWSLLSLTIREPVRNCWRSCHAIAGSWRRISSATASTTPSATARRRGSRPISCASTAGRWATSASAMAWSTSSLPWSAAISAESCRGCSCGADGPTPIS